MGYNVTLNISRQMLTPSTSFLCLDVYCHCATDVKGNKPLSLILTKNLVVSSENYTTKHQRRDIINYICLRQSNIQCDLDVDMFDSKL